MRGARSAACMPETPPVIPIFNMENAAECRLAPGKPGETPDTPVCASGGILVLEWFRGGLEEFS